MTSLQARGRGLALPVFFPAVSSVKDDHPLALHLELLATLGAPTALTSAYDWVRAFPGNAEGSRAAYFAWSASGGTMILDSGRYEAYWHRDSTWRHEDYVRVALELMPAFVMCFDEPAGEETAEEQAAAAELAWQRDQNALVNSTVVPIVHGHPESLPTAVSLVATRTLPPLIAVAERELGDGIVARSVTVRRIVDALSSTGNTVPLHVLGAGSPTSVLILAHAGAQSFDGLEWNRTVVDFDTARLHHTQHYDFFQTQSAVPEEGSYWARVLTHNLIFWRRWINRIRSGEAGSMLEQYLPPMAGDHLALFGSDTAR